MFFFQVKFTKHVSSQLNPGALVAVPAEWRRISFLEGAERAGRSGGELLAGLQVSM